MAGQLQNGAPTSTQVGNYNTYVGARYVPIIYGEWDARVAYEPLTIVTYQGNSYTSKQYVPIGVQITNETYWVMTGNFNGQVASLEEMVIRNTQSINVLDGDVAMLQSQVSDLETAAKDKYIIIADSYGDAGSYGQVGWTSKIAKYMGWGASDYEVQQFYGSGFADGDKNFLQLLQSITSNPNDVTYVVVQTAGNDYNQNLSTVTANFNTFISYCKNTFPRLKAVIIIPTFYFLTTTGYGQNLLALFRGAGYPVLMPQFSNNYVHDLYYHYTDTGHLTTAGYDLLAKSIAYYLRGNEIIIETKLQSITVNNEVYKGVIFTWKQDNMIFFALNGKVTLATGNADIDLYQLTRSDHVYAFRPGLALGECYFQGRQTLVRITNAMKVGLQTSDGGAWNTFSSAQINFIGVADCTWC